MGNSVIENAIDPAIIANKLDGDEPGDTTMNAAFQKLLHQLKERKG